jgi:hypothetical protein
MAQEAGIYRRKDSRFWWIDTTLSNGQRVCRSSKTEDRQQAEAYVAKLRHEAFQAGVSRRKALADVAGGRAAVPGSEGESSQHRGCSADLSPARPYLGSLTWIRSAVM